MSKVVYHADLNEAQRQPDLAALGCAPFDRLDWFALLAGECLSGRTPALAVARDGDRLAALPLLAGGERELAGIANWYSFFVRPLGDPSLLPDIARDLAARADRLTLSPLPEADANLLAEAFGRSGWIALVEPCDNNHYLELGGRNFDEYWASRPGRLRETVRRKGKKGMVGLKITTSFDADDWAAYEHVYGLSWKPEEGSPAFLRRFAMAEAAAGRLRMGVAEIEGVPVAAQLWSVENDVAYIHKLAHDEGARQHSPGTLLSHALFRHVIDVDKVREIDFGTGNDPYKRDWMESVRQRWRLDAWRMAAPRQWPSLGKALARRMLRPRPLVSAEAHG
ncbi:MAG: GNAT family N-acetyltransferase [Sphingomonadales bacterium]|nr:GNAT family N-acetyltransferase [Sphingomonadales bacterium]MDE2570078.1 GNAT family N-acetyltransferase [Sphingomonadales bacterium]